MRTLPQKLALAVILVTVPSVATAQFAGGDDFEDDIIDTTHWILADDTDAVVETGGTLRLISASTNWTGVGLYWSPGADSASNWLAQVDIRLPFPGSIAQRASWGNTLRMSVSAWPPPVTNWACFFINVSVSPACVYRLSDQSEILIPNLNSSIWDQRVVGATGLRSTGIAMETTLASVRLRWEASKRVMLAEIDVNGPIDGYQWITLACRHIEDYGWEVPEKFAVFLYGMLNSPLTVDDNCNFDNFRTAYYASTPSSPSLSQPTRLGASSVMEFASELRASYTLEAKDALQSLDWHPLQSVIGDGGVVTVVDPLTMSPQRYYRLRSP